MADFTANGNDIDKYDDLIMFPWRVAGINPQDGAGRRTTNQNWHDEIGATSYNNGGMRVATPPFDLAAVDGDIIIMGHGNYGDRIGKDAGYVHSARSLAKLLADSGLPLNFGGKIILWSCFAGVAGGAAESLAFKLYGRGYNGLSVWGCRWVTGVIANKTLLCRPGTTMANVNGQSADATLADMAVY